MTAHAVLTIRSARPSDYVRLLERWRTFVEATHGFLTAADVDALEADVSAYLPRKTDLRVAVDTEDLPLGFIAQDSGEIHMLFVGAEQQGLGIGTLLLDAVAADSGVLTVDVNEQNPAGRRFYAARGFTVVGRSEFDGEGRPFPLLHLRRGL